MRRRHVRDVLAASTTTARQALGEEGSDEARDAGNAMSLNVAVGYAQRGRGERKRPSHGWASLTAAELRVAELVAQGRTNPQIGEQLFVSRETVKGHVASIFVKLGLSSRTELAAELTRRHR
jgi:DNA-binding CsgD family transcriptional regulator